MVESTDCFQLFARVYFDARHRAEPGRREMLSSCGRHLER